ncbi:hypothetical protein H4R33_004601 [Dimargaris cristalligena]|nr:hypothetical protein H4R33_004601 [Dimargaris cristalligena]
MQAFPTSIDTPLYDQSRCTENKGFAAPSPYFLQPIKVHHHAGSSGQGFPFATKPYKANLKARESSTLHQPSAKFTLKRMGLFTESRADASRVTSASTSPSSLRPTSPTASLLGSPTSSVRGGVSSFSPGSVNGSTANPTRRIAVHPSASKFDAGINIRLQVLAIQVWAY